MSKSTMTYKVTEMFQSINGEVNGFGQGSITNFIRFHGCNFNCWYCDQKDAMLKDNFVECDSDCILESLDSRIRNITITGGEPLYRKGMIELIEKLMEYNFNINVETNGSNYISRREFPGRYHPFLTFTVDYKLSSSAEDIITNDNKIIVNQSMAMDLDLFKGLLHNDFVKFLIGSQQDFDESIKVQNRLIKEGCGAQFAYSPINGTENGFSGKEILEKLIFNVKMSKLKNLNNVFINSQVHKNLGIL